jgi:threonine dehydrogenase-like Zn-dependent dehydrogenase
MTGTTIEIRRSVPTMRALVLDNSLRLGQLPRPVPGSGEALVRMRSCGISRADLDMVQGRAPVQVRPVVLGHQFVGEVHEVAETSGREWIGRRVVARTHLGCGRCVSCLEHRAWLCETGRANGLGMGLIDGAFAEWLTVPVRALVAVPDTVDDDEAVFVHPVALAREAVALVEGPAPQRVLVVGDGNMGLLLTLMLHAAGHTVTVFGRHPSRRDLLWRSGIGFTGVAEGATSESLPADDFSREAFGTVFECSGRVSGFDLATSAVRPRGRLVVLSHHVGQPGVDLRFLVEREAELVGVSTGPVEAALEFLARRTVDILPLVHARVSLGEGLAAYEQSARRGALKIILENDTPRPGGRP